MSSFITIPNFKILLIIVIFNIPTANAQQGMDADAWMIKNIHSTILSQGQSYEWLKSLVSSAPGRLAGSPSSLAAVELTRQIMDTFGLDRVYLQPCKVPHWVRGDREIVKIINSPFIGDLNLDALSLGNSIGTGSAGLTSEVIEVKSLDTLEKLGVNALSGKIVFFNRAFDETQFNTFGAYGGAVDQRGRGPALAAKYGAVAALVRSVTGDHNDIPHTGATGFGADDHWIPALALSTNSADALSRELKRSKVSVFIRNTCKMMGMKDSYSVIGEIKGSENTNEIIAVGGHLDSWDVAPGAHDDGSGCVQSMEVLYQLKKMNYKPKHTLRSVLFMNEENGLGGGRAYADSSNKNKEKHILALESDSGGFTPRGFGFAANSDVFEGYFKKVNQWANLLEPYDLRLKVGHGGADIGPLKSQGGLLADLSPDSQRYFNYHHTRVDGIEAVNPRELLLGAAAMTSLVYLVDKYGLR